MNSVKKQLNILTIDDDPITLETIVGFLEFDGHKIVTAIDGEDGLKKFQSEKFDVVLTDIQMPEMSGLEVLERIKQIQSGMPVIVVSGAGDLAESIEALRLDAWDYVQKPIDFTLLKNSIYKAYERTCLLEENKRYSENLEDEILFRTSELLQRTKELENSNLQLTNEIDQRKKVEEEKSLLEEEIQKSKNLESLGSLAGGIAHDFNNLLAALEMHIEYARLEVNDKQHLFKTFDNAKTVIRIAANLTEQLLTFAKGGSPLISEIYLHDLINISIFPWDKKNDQVNFCISLPDTLWPIKGDKSQLSTIFGHILFNSVESMQEGGEILIEAKNTKLPADNAINLPAGNFVKINISDKGRGISKVDISKIFDPYFTTKGMDSTKGKGLGLAVSYSVVKKHGGNITISSVVNQGTTVSIYLPAQVQIQAQS